MKLQEHLKEIGKEFHLRHGYEFNFTESQSEAHFDITTGAAMSYLQGLAMSGKIGELQNLFKSGAEALQNSSYYQELIKKCIDSYYALDWDEERKRHLAETALVFAIGGLKNKFEQGGYSNDMQGVLSFIGLDSGVLGMLGKAGGMFGNLFKKK